MVPFGAPGAGVPGGAFIMRCPPPTGAKQTAAKPGYAPDVFDVVADAVEPFAGDGSEDPAPFCAVCGGDIGVFLKFGLDWRHYRGTDLTDLELFEAGHRPVLAWRSPGLPA